MTKFGFVAGRLLISVIGVKELNITWISSSHHKCYLKFCSFLFFIRKIYSLMLGKMRLLHLIVNNSSYIIKMFFR